MRMFMEKERKNLLSQIGRFAPSQSAKSNWITYAVIAAAFILVQILTASGNLSSLWKGLLVPLCTYVILAVSLNLTVGILGELSLGHAYSRKRVPSLRHIRTAASAGQGMPHVP